MLVHIRPNHQGYHPRTSHHGRQRPIVSLSLPVRLRIVCACERVRYVEDLVSFLEELGRKLGSIIG